MEIELLLLLLFPIYFLTLFSLSLCSANAILAVASSPSLAKPNCPSHCGSIEIPYPFGIGQGCYPDNEPSYLFFEILCDNSTNPPKPFLNLGSDSVPEVLGISLSGGTLRINNPILFSDCPHKTNHPQLPNLEPTPFSLPGTNRFTSVSCGRIASLQTFYGALKIAVCLSVCARSAPVMASNTCSGINCCQTSLLFDDTSHLRTSFGPLINDTGGSETSCKYAFLVDPDWFTSNSTNTSAIGDNIDYVPLLLRWRFYGMDNSTDDSMNRNCESQVGPCSCAKGYQGNPYLPRGGCQDINECERRNIRGSGVCSNIPGSYMCYYNQQHGKLQPIKLVLYVLCSAFGLILIIIGTWWLHKVIKQMRIKKQKRKFYVQNGGLLLEELLSSSEVNVEKIKLFDAKELAKATDQYNVDRVLGEGGQGTVYKGMLTDGSIVAVKMSKIIDGGDASQFINEIVILSQINHRNVVKILECCLESKVPLLVYEFLPNGTLSQYIHSRDDDFPLTWEMRIRVGIEVAASLSYLHSFASMPIYHRDNKSSNILLDEKHRAKVADFGTSRTVSVDKTHLTMTHVNGTFGYLDPEYFQYGQFSDKSDVYSFGVVLAELLTGQKSIIVTRAEDGSQEWRSLAIYFTASMDEDFLFDILDPEVIKGGKNDDVMVVANLTKRCLDVKGKKRPTMKEVAFELEGILKSSISSGVEQSVDVECHHREITDARILASTSTWSHMHTSSLMDEQPLMTFKSF